MAKDIIKFIRIEETYESYEKKDASVLHRDSFVYPNAFGGNRKDHTGSLFRAEKKKSAVF